MGIEKYLKDGQYKSYEIDLLEIVLSPVQHFQVFIPKLDKSKQSLVLRDLSSILTETCRKHAGNLTEFYEARSRISVSIRIGVSK